MPRRRRVGTSPGCKDSNVADDAGCRVPIMITQCHALAGLDSKDRRCLKQFGFFRRTRATASGKSHAEAPSSVQYCRVQGSVRRTDDPTICISVHVSERIDHPLDCEDFVPCPGVAHSGRTLMNLHYPVLFSTLRKLHLHEHLPSGARRSRRCCLLEITDRTIYRLFLQEYLCGHGRKVWCFSREEVNSWIKQQ